MAFSQALIASRKLPVAQRRRCVVTRAAEAEPVYTQPTTATPLAEPGKKLNEWLKTPFDLAAFGPRVTVGALLSAPERFGRLQAEVQRVTEVLNSPAPVEDKTKMLAVELETCAPIACPAILPLLIQRSQCWVPICTASTRARKGLRRSPSSLQHSI